jgi:hypothetical protein
MKRLIALARWIHRFLEAIRTRIQPREGHWLHRLWKEEPQQ